MTDCIDLEEKLKASNKEFWDDLGEAPTIHLFFCGLWLVRNGKLAFAEGEYPFYVSLVLAAYKDRELLTTFSEYDIALAIVHLIEVTAVNEDVFRGNSFKANGRHKGKAPTSFLRRTTKPGVLKRMLWDRLTETEKVRKKLDGKYFLDYVAQDRVAGRRDIVLFTSEAKYDFAKPFPVSGGKQSFFICKRAPPARNFREMIKLRKRFRSMQRREQRIADNDVRNAWKNHTCTGKNENKAR